MEEKVFEEIAEKVSQTLVKAGSVFPEDRYGAYERGIAGETEELSCWAMKEIVRNAESAARKHSPLCDDTGIPHLILEVGGSGR